MVYCKVCEGEVEAHQEEPSGYTVCTSCGHVLDHSAWSSEPTFTKEGGESTVAGHFVSDVAGTHGLGRISGGRIYGFQYDASEKAGSKGRHEIERLVDLLGIRPRDDVVNSAHRLYMLAVQHNFNRGRRTAHIAAASIYIICRQEGHPFMLLDFSDMLQVNVFVLGAVFLQLCKILRLEEHAILTRPVDPSLFLHRFAARMGFGDKMHQVANTALRLVSSMKRDWLQTGRRPAGICGAALYIAGHIHGFPITREDVIRIVHIGESTLEKRVSEFTSTDASELTAIEFEEHSKALEHKEQLRLQTIESVAALAGPWDPTGHGCEHLAQGVAIFAHGMCKECYMTFLTVSGGLDTDGANPPAFTAGQKKANESLALENGEATEQPLLLEYPGQEIDAEQTNGASSGIEAEMASALHDSQLHSIAQAVVPNSDIGRPPLATTRARKRKQQQQDDLEATKVAETRRKRQKSEILQQPASDAAGVADSIGGDSQDILPAAGQIAPASAGEAAVDDDAQENEGLTLAFENPPEELSDLSSDEEEDYFNSAAEVKLKGIVWNALNQDYLEKQALKAAAEAKRQEKAALNAGENGTQKRKGRPKGKANKPKEIDELGPSESAADGVKKMLDAKKLSSKVNYANLDSLFDDSIPLTSEPTSPKTAGRPPKGNGKGGGSQKPKAAPGAKTTASKSKLLVPEAPADPAQTSSQAAMTKPKKILRSSALGSLKSSGLAKGRLARPTDSIL